MKHALIFLSHKNHRKQSIIVRQLQMKNYAIMNYHNLSMQLKNKATINVEEH